ncbi:MAG: VanZ family protein [Planctomycetia bacterium]|nr:VanZ family protein [Planctomycetia bacterium]
MTALSSTDSIKSRAVRWLTAAVLFVYWCAMATGTHVPVPPKVTEGFWDKGLHGSAYAGLMFLAAVCWSMYRRPTWRALLAIAAACSCYGIVDELLQIPVGRDCDFFDWVADSIGVTGGLAAFVGAQYVWRFVTGAEPDHSPATSNMAD